MVKFFTSLAFLEGVSSVSAVHQSEKSLQDKFTPYSFSPTWQIAFYLITLRKKKKTSWCRKTIHRWYADDNRNPLVSQMLQNVKGNWTNQKDDLLIHKLKKKKNL